MQAIIYMWQVSACMGIFYGFYYFMLRRLTFFTINRWYLLATMLLSFIIPMLTITVHEQSAPAVIQKAVIVNQEMPSSGFELATPVGAAAPVIDWVQIADIVYLIVTVVLFIKLVITIARFFRNVKRASITTIGRVRIIKGNKNISNGSFFNYILLADDGLSTSEAEQVIAHELLHVRYFHSVDRVLVKLVQIILWFNPFAYRYAQAIEENHEFEVDLEIGKRADKSNYADMLLHLSINRQDILFNSFSKVPLKRRITMLFTKPTNHMKKIIYLLILPVVIISCLAFARFKKDVQPKQYSVIDMVDVLNGDIKVFIDGKLYDKDILYKISGSCVASSSVSPGSKSAIVDGQLKNAIVKIKTFNGKIVYMTPIEKDNLIKERSIPLFQFYTRLKLVDNNGKRFDKIIIQFSRGSETSSIGANDKAGFLVDNVFYTEEQVKNFTDEKIRSLSPKSSIRPAKPGEYAKGIVTIFQFKTIKTAAAINKTETKKAALPIVNEAQNAKGVKTDYVNKENDTITSAENQIIQRALKNANSPFFNRFHFDRTGGKGVDVVAFKVGEMRITAPLDVDKKSGAYIDGRFYNEDALKKISPERAATLDIDNRPDYFNREKIPDDANYAVWCSLKTKSIALSTMKPNDSNDEAGKVNQTEKITKKTGIDSIAAHSAMIGQEVLNRSSYPQFYSRVKFNATDGKDYDVVTCTIGKGIVSIEVKLNANVGLLIDGVFYNEDAIKKLPASKTKALEMWSEGLDASKVTIGYLAAFSLRTKKT
ncbi:MAG: hypothetical protein JWR50_795 [Mucilaginibacter sp.]|nr:hypothetical protein [Mucilaginibacter sp.]